MVHQGGDSTTSLEDRGRLQVWWSVAWPSIASRSLVVAGTIAEGVGDRKVTTPTMQQRIVLFCVFLVVVGLIVSSIPSTDAAPQQSYWGQFDEEDPEATKLMEIIARLGHTIMRNPELENTKRGLDLGLSRGFSGSQAAKHLMGLAAANYAGGPGRRRRSEQP
ncbi:Diuretic hormone class 2 [Dufourea novaeangliae]|uniref:Diuretic hormone class 2 n=2 Tax=Dufourea novaeangliae TaxID=178035 RepID=A0A154P5G3_DUFNO|nr:Diuretic hormone class 2 [Dufourea novaeangliae]